MLMERNRSLMLIGSALKGYAVEATDGRIGTVEDFLFNDLTFKVRWLVVDTGNWLPGRKVLIHPSAIVQTPQAREADYEEEQLAVRLTMAQVKASSSILEDAPVSLQMEGSLYGYYGWDPLWGGDGSFGAYPDERLAAELEAERLDRADPHLRSMNAVTGYHIRATDGTVGHVENFLIDRATGEIRYLIVDTMNWWFGQPVLISPYAVRDISWEDQQVRVNVSRQQIKASPAWKPEEMIDRAYEQHLHGYYGWPGYDW